MTDPIAADFKAYFTRDFPYGTTTAEVMDADITKALAQAAFNFNSALFGTQAEYSMAFLYLAAHYLVIDLRMASQGMASSHSWFTASKSVGSVSESYTVPQYIQDHPVLGMIAKTGYGAKYIEMMLPRLVGQMFVVEGATGP